MASSILYPPVVDSHMPAFLADSPSDTNSQEGCKIYFNFSKFNGIQDAGWVHISIIKQKTGENAVNTEDDETTGLTELRLRRTGIILNAKIQTDTTKTNLYYVEIKNKDIKNGWNPGTIYKVQLRFSRIQCTKEYISRQQEWLNNNASDFSEWSTVCVIKPINPIIYTIPYLGIDSSKSNTLNNNNSTRIYYFSTLELSGHFNIDSSLNEFIHSYRFQLYDENAIDPEIDKPLEDSGEIYLNQYETNNDSFHYIFKTEFEDTKVYKIAFKFVTKSGYEGGFYKWNSEGLDQRFTIECSYTLLNNCPCRLISLENDVDDLVSSQTSLEMEEDEGRIGLKFYRPIDSYYSGNLCIRRTDSRTNFKEWHDIYIGVIKNDYINNAPIFFDYTIESGVYYLYGVQEIDQNGFRSKLSIMNYKLMRNFNYSFLLGKNNQQLKLMFDNTMPNFRYQIYDSKIDTIGSKYSVVTRNAATCYRTFPINGLISFWMDENKLFCDKQDIYQYEDVVDLYDRYNTIHNIKQYDYIYERDFRNKVLEFLQDGEFKLFKSPTEGNIIVRLMDINCVPNQSLDRMLYSFSANASEMADNTIDNYIKYGFCTLRDPETDFSTRETRLGQIQIDYKLDENTNHSEDIFQLIYDKYDTNREDKEINELIVKVEKIHNLKITFDGKPLRVLDSGNNYTLGNNFQINENQITVFNPGRIYEFDENITYTRTDKLYLLGPNDDDTKKYNRPIVIPVTIDFLYDAVLEIYQGKRIKTRDIRKGIGQIYKNYNPYTNLFNEIFYKYYLETDTKFSKISNLTYIELEANPGAVFEIMDAEDTFPEQHTIGITGILHLYNIEDIVALSYLGMRDPDTGEIIPESTDIICNYSYVLVTGEYEVEAT